MNIQKYLYLFCIILFASYLNANELRILTNEEPPTNYLNKDKKIVGITVDIVERLKKELNIKTNIEIMTWDRAYKIAQKEDSIVLFTAGKTFQRMKLGFHFIGPIVTKQHILFSKADSNFDISTALDIKNKGLTVGAMRGDWRAQFFKDKGLTIHESTTHQMNFHKLMTNKIDLWTSSNLEAPFIAKKANTSSDQIKQSYVFKEFSSYIILSKKTPKDEIKKWKRAYSKLQRTDFFNKTAQKWSEILNIDLKYSKSKGFYKQ